MMLVQYTDLTYVPVTYVRQLQRSKVHDNKLSSKGLQTSQKFGNYAVLVQITAHDSDLLRRVPPHHDHEARGLRG
jgi:hypothetical protein